MTPESRKKTGKRKAQPKRKERMRRARIKNKKLIPKLRILNIREVKDGDTSRKIKERIVINDLPPLKEVVKIKKQKGYLGVSPLSLWME